MGLTDLIFRKDDNVVGTVAFDCFVSENHHRDCEVTEHAIEDGATISDHIILKPDSIDLVGIISNTPALVMASLTAPCPITTDLVPVIDRAEVANDELDRIMKDGEIVEVITSLKTYKDMAIVAKSVTRDADTGNILSVSLSLRKIIKATTKTKLVGLAGAIPDNPYHNETKDEGTKTTQEATEGQGDSMLEKTLQAAGI